MIPPLEFKINHNRGDSLTKVENLTTMSNGSWRWDIKGVLRAKGQWHCAQQAYEEVVAMLGMLSEKEIFDLETQFHKALGTVLCNVDHTCKEMIRDCTSAQETWDYLKEQLEGKERYTKIYLLQVLYNTRLYEKSLETDAY